MSSEEVGIRQIKPVLPFLFLISTFLDLGFLSEISVPQQICGFCLKELVGSLARLNESEFPREDVLGSLPQIHPHFGVLLSLVSLGPSPLLGTQQAL